MERDWRGRTHNTGISIGHNEYGAWGLTVFNTDGEDLLVYEVNPENPDEYRYNGQWEPMSVIEKVFLCGVRLLSLSS